MGKKGRSFLPQFLKDGFINAIDRPIDLFIRLNIHPNFFTILGLLIAILAAIFYAMGDIRLGGAFVLLAGMSDTFDGKIARKQGIASKFGAVFDSSLDRYAEFLMFFGLGAYFLQLGDQVSIITAIVAFIALIGSVMVSYVRARAEGIGYECKVGVMQRAERIVFTGVSSLIHPIALMVVIWIIAILANVTAIQRMHYVWKTERAELAKENIDETLGI
jgi:CDP-diacylglycerol--glycerol-3-phosphate 3-phosphatidyltransferase